MREKKLIHPQIAGSNSDVMIHELIFRALQSIMALNNLLHSNNL